MNCDTCKCKKVVRVNVDTGEEKVTCLPKILMGEDGILSFWEHNQETMEEKSSMILIENYSKPIYCDNCLHDGNQGSSISMCDVCKKGSEYTPNS